MFITTVIISALYAAVLLFSALGKVTGNEQVVTSLVGIGFPRDRISLLAVPLAGGAVGLVAGLFWAPIGIAAAIGLVVYFALAVGAHLSAHDTKGAPAPGLLLVIAVAVLVLRSVTA